MLPDIIGGWLNPEWVRLDLSRACAAYGCWFINDEAGAIDMAKRKISLSGSIGDYKYLICRQ